MCYLLLNICFDQFGIPKINRLPIVLKETLVKSGKGKIHAERGRKRVSTAKRL